MTTTIDDLSPDEKVTYAIGAVARAHEYLERQVLQVWIFMAGQGIAAYAAPKRFLDRLDGIRAMLPHAGHAPEVMDLGAAAIAAVKSAHDLRNELVHGVWGATDQDFQGPFVRIAEKPGYPAREVAERTVEQFMSAAETISRAMFKISGLMLLGSLGSTRFIRPGDDGYNQHLDLLKGFFDVENRQSALVWNQDDPRRAAPPLRGQSGRGPRDRARKD